MEARTAIRDALVPALEEIGVRGKTQPDLKLVGARAEEEAVTEVSEDQFVWTANGLVHEPTGARFNPKSSVGNWGNAGVVLPDGRDFDRDEVLAVAQRIIATQMRK